MAEYYVDSLGSGTDPYDTEAKAAPDFYTLNTAKGPFLNGDKIWITAETTEGHTYTEALTIAGPNVAGEFAEIISYTRGTSPKQIASPTAYQIDTGNTYGLTFNFGWKLHRPWVRGGTGITFNPSSAWARAKDVRFGVRYDSILWLNANAFKMDDITLDCDGSFTTGTIAMIVGGFINGLTLVNAHNRTGQIIGFPYNSGANLLRNLDLSGCTYATPPALFQMPPINTVRVVGVKLPPSWNLVSGNPGGASDLRVTEYSVAGENHPERSIHRDALGGLDTSNSIYRTGGASGGGNAFSWNILTTSVVTLHNPYRTPWIQAGVVSTGSKTFSLQIVHDTAPAAGFTDAEAWLEVEYKASATDSWKTVATDQVALNGTPATQPTDGVSTWNGAGPSFTYKQTLSVTVTVSTTGEFRVRPCFGKASIAFSDNCFVCPKVTVT